MFKHSICGIQPEVPDGMPDSSDTLPSEFFVSPKCPPILAVTEATTAKVDLIEMAKNLEENAFVGVQS